jgi:hypothetical protein
MSLIKWKIKPTTAVTTGTIIAARVPFDISFSPDSPSPDPVSLGVVDVDLGSFGIVVLDPDSLSVVEETTPTLSASFL